MYSSLIFSSYFFAWYVRMCLSLFIPPRIFFPHFLSQLLSFFILHLPPLLPYLSLSRISVCVRHFLSSLPLLSSSLSFARYRSRLLRRHGRSSPCSSHISSQSTRGPIEVYIPTSRHRHGLSACSWQRAYQRCPHPLFMGDNPIHWLV